MSHTRAPVPANNPASITLPDDGDPKPVAVVNAAIAAVQDLVSRRVEGAVSGSSGHIAGYVTVDSSALVAWATGSSLIVNPTVNVLFDSQIRARNGVKLESGHQLLVDENSTVVCTGGGSINVQSSASPSSVAQRITTTGKGRWVPRPAVTSLDSAGLKVTACDGDVFAPLALTANRTITVTTTNTSPGAEAPVDGDELLFTLVPLGANANTWSLVNDAANPIADLRNASGFPVATRLKLIGGQWRPIMSEYVP